MDVILTVDSAKGGHGKQHAGISVLCTPCWKMYEWQNRQHRIDECNDVAFQLETAWEVDCWMKFALGSTTFQLEILAIKGR